jgi:hypothetical protein
VNEVQGKRTSLRRYFILAQRGEDVIELVKIEQTPRRTVIGASLASHAAQTASIHTTHHAATAEKCTRIMHVSDSKGTDERVYLEPNAPVVSLGALILDLSDIEWRERPFKKTAYDEKWIVDVDRDGSQACIWFFYGFPQALIAALDAWVHSDEWSMFLFKKPDAFGSPPAGHAVQCARLVFDDEAAETVGCLVMTCEPVPRDAVEEPTTVEAPFAWVAYGAEGKVERGGA